MKRHAIMKRSLSAAESLRQKAAHDAATAANIRTRVIGPRGEFDRRIIAEVVRGGYEYRFHATKGLRVKRNVLSVTA